ncbi:ribonuclease H-like domain-containing protein [Mycena metata]|uniref:Ribonuclease H-like domain-containing protein n=1 Tax=Mycena metata TaxID=1033252 RepID=A0AAD7K7J4_9AGAR|nr:ribonuclease H-like domain-containing protein [Mycena metata]
MLARKRLFLLRSPPSIPTTATRRVVQTPTASHASRSQGLGLSRLNALSKSLSASSSDFDTPAPTVAAAEMTEAEKAAAERLVEIEDRRVVVEELDQYAAEGILNERSPEFQDFDLLRYWEQGDRCTPARESLSATVMEMLQILKFIYRKSRISFTEGLVATEEELSVIVDPGVLEHLLATALGRGGALATPEFFSVRPKGKALAVKALGQGLGVSRVGAGNPRAFVHPSVRCLHPPWSFQHRDIPSPTMVENPLAVFFHRGELQNKKMYYTYCKACVTEELKRAGATSTTLTQGNQAFKDACTTVGSTRGEKNAWIAHILGGRSPCPYASAEATAEATLQRTGSQSEKRQRTESTPTAAADASAPPPKKQKTQSTLSNLVFRRHDMPYSPEEKAALEVQALRAIASSGAPFQLFADPEMKILFGMMRTMAPDALPNPKVIGGRLLNSAAEEVEEKISLSVPTGGKEITGRPSTASAQMLILKYAYLLELINATADKKDGPSQCENFAKMIDHVELKYGCFVIYLTTDADGGSKKGRTLLGKQRPWLILLSCWAHQFQLILGDYFKVNDTAAYIAEDATGLIAWINNHSLVRMIFDVAQRTITQNAGRILVLAYLVANLTRWTTHFVAFMQLFLLREALEFAVLQNRAAIIAAQVGAAVSTEAARLKEDAEKYCALIRDRNFWDGLETVLGDLEPICLGTNINQKDSARPDQVLLTIVGIFLRFAEHPELEVKAAMLKHIEKRWLDCDQPLYWRMKSRPNNPDTSEEKAEKDKELSKAFMQYLAGTGDFADLNDWEEIEGNTDPILAWEALADSRHLAELANFAILILKIVVNQAGCERTFSRTKIEQTDHRNRLGLDKMDKRTKVRADIRADHEWQGLIKPRQGRKNHKSVGALLAVPRYRDLLEDQEDKDPNERGRALVSSTDGWRTEMAKWVADSKAAEVVERAEAAEKAKWTAQRETLGLDSDSELEEEDTPRLPKTPRWKPITLVTLFGLSEKPLKRKPSARVLEEEERLMEALAEMEARADADEDARMDDGAIEIDSDDEYR